MASMNRRDALKTTTTLVGGALVASTGVLATTACNRDERQRAPASTTTADRVLSADDQALAEEIADTLLPTTPRSPGAKAAGAGAAINLLLSDCYEPKDQRRAVRGLADFRAACRDRSGGRAFTSLSPVERERFVREIDAEAQKAESQKAGEPHYFALLRELAHRAYFSSEVGMTKALRYVQTPGRWEGCTRMEPGQAAWG